MSMSASNKEMRQPSANQSLFMRALRQQPVARTPIWLMRQAGRYMPEYRQLRSQAKDFTTLCENPELACEVTLLPLRRYALDAAIIFSDILLIGQVMGSPLQFLEGQGPVFETPIRTLAQIEQLQTKEASEKLSFVAQAIKWVTAEINDTPLIGFCGSPWTVATYMVEGGTSKDFRHIRTMAWTQPDALLRLLDKLAQVTIDYLKSQIHAGASALMIFDTWGGILSDQAYQTLAMPSIRKIIDALKADPLTQNTPIILFAKGKYTLFEALINTGVNALSIDWTVELGWVRQQVKGRVALQGNLDPTILLGTPTRLQEEVKRVLESFGAGPGHIFNLGHGILPQTDPDQVQRLIEWVHQYSQAGKN